MNQVFEDLCPPFPPFGSTWFHRFFKGRAAAIDRSVAYQSQDQYIDSPDAFNLRKLGKKGVKLETLRFLIRAPVKV